MKYALVLLTLLLAYPAAAANRVDVDKVVQLIEDGFKPTVEVMPDGTKAIVEYPPPKEFRHEGTLYLAYYTSLLQMSSGLYLAALVVDIQTKEDAHDIIVDLGLTGKVTAGVHMHTDTALKNQAFSSARFPPDRCQGPACEVTGLEFRDYWQKRYDDAVDAVLKSIPKSKH